jgi:hypothetical protein
MMNTSDYAERRLALVRAFCAAMDADAKDYDSEETERLTVEAFDLAKSYGWDYDDDPEWSRAICKATGAEILADGLRFALGKRLDRVPPEFRVNRATENAIEVFWAEVVRCFPDIKTGDLDPDVTFQFEQVCQATVKRWVSLNTPEPRPTVIETRRGPFDIAATRKELDEWTMERCLRWLANNDPNGEWSNFLNDPEWAQENLGPLTVEDARDQLWDQMEEAVS